MNIKSLRIGLCLSLSLMLLTGSFAQTTTPAPTVTTAPVTNAPALDFIAGYQSIANSLEAARTTVSNDPTAALAGIQSAQNVFRRLEPLIGTQKLIEAGTSALKRASTTVTQRSAVNLSAQSMLVKSILQRVMYDRLFLDMSNGRIPSATRYANTLAKVFSMLPAITTTLQKAVKRNDFAKARVILESQVADIMVNSLKIAQGNVADKATAYQAIVRASSHFLIVQDSNRVGDELTVSGFANAVQSLTTNDIPGFKQSVANLLSQTQAFGKRARGIALSASNPSTVNPNVTQPSIVTNVPTTKPTVTTTNPTVTTPTPTVVVAAPVQNSSLTINNELSKLGIPAAKAKALANVLAAQKFASFNGALDSVSGSLNDALAQVQNGAILDGRASLEQARNVFNSVVKPVLEVNNAGQAAQTAQVFDATINATGVRPMDVAVLQGEMFSVKNLFKNIQPAALQNLSASVQPWWAGMLRGALFLLTGLFFIYPMYLLNLAFGGKNPYWRYIGIALVLLFIPPILEGLAWLGSLLSQTTGMGFFDGLGALSLTHNPLAQIVWLLTLIGAAVFATLGLRGIATQFGLIRNRNQPTLNNASVTPVMLGATGTGTAKNPKASTTDTTDPRISSDVSVNPDRTIVEWDEEF